MATEIVDCAFRIHRDLGPGLLESVCESVLSKLLENRGLTVQRQRPVSIFYEGRTFWEGFRADLIVNRAVLIELKSVEALAPVHYEHALTYLRLLQLPRGFLINSGAPTLREGCRRIVNGQPNLIRPSQGGLVLHSHPITRTVLVSPFVRLRRFTVKKRKHFVPWQVVSR